MKKLLILGIVLGMASMANASLLLSINGTPSGDLVDDLGQPSPGEIWIEPSDWVVVDVHVGPTNYNVSFDLNIALSNAQAAWLVPEWVTGGIPPTSGWVNIAFPTLYTFAPGTVAGTPTPQAINVIGVMNTNDYAGPLAVIVDQIMLHCEDDTDTVLTLSVNDAAGMRTFDTEIGGWGEVEYTTGQVLDTIIIHQPEPMTMALLGLGGLALIRRRRA